MFVDSDVDAAAERTTAEHAPAPTANPAQAAPTGRADPAVTGAAPIDQTSPSTTTAPAASAPASAAAATTSGDTAAATTDDANAVVDAAQGDPAATTASTSNPVAVLVAAQASIVTTPAATTTTTTPAPQVQAAPGELAALALARVAQDAAAAAAPAGDATTADSAAAPAASGSAAATTAATQAVTQLLAGTDPQPTLAAAPSLANAASLKVDPKPAAQGLKAASDTGEAKKSETKADGTPVDATDGSSAKPHKAADSDTTPSPAIGDRAPNLQPQPTADRSAAGDPAVSLLAGQTNTSHSTGHGTTATPTTQNLTASTNLPTNIPVAGLAVQLVANAQIGRSRFEIRLDPPELGRVEVKLDVDKKGQVTSHIVVEKPATLDLLRRDAPQLERALQDAGLKTSDNGLSFSLRDQQQQAGRQNDNDSGQRGQRLLVTDEDTTPRPAAAAGYGRMLTANGGIDMRV